MKVLDAAAMREVDRRAIEELGIPSLVLMENAASGVADALAASYPESGRVAIFCGPGNNGGDGLALARILSNRGWEVTTVLVHGGKELSGDAGTQRSIVAAMGLPVLEVAGEEDLERSLRTVRAHEVVVDALFGTGLDRPLEDLFGRTVDALDGLGIPLVAVDIPSGLDASRSERIGPSTHADLTVTFAAPKRAHLFAPAADAVGRVVVVDLGIPDELVQEAEGVELLEGADLSSLLPSRRAHTHKGSYGHLLVVAGSRGTLGAAILASRAAVRAGAGLVTLGVSRELVPFADIASIESMTLGYDAVEGGRIGRAGIDVVLEACRERDALAMGPGMGTGRETGDAIRVIALRAPVPGGL
ncbi:MAG: NAD(P)H-hydrate epimerase, partial [Thermoanaerobaculia bacterium]|nr:NAD(P)H-hydrate epimerase [Thermoanaerobaculia bacterium]